MCECVCLSASLHGTTLPFGSPSSTPLPPPAEQTRLVRLVPTEQALRWWDRHPPTTLYVRSVSIWHCRLIGRGREELQTTQDPVSRRGRFDVAKGACALLRYNRCKSVVLLPPAWHHYPPSLAGMGGVMMPPPTSSVEGCLKREREAGGHLLRQAETMGVRGWGPVQPQPHLN